MDNKTQKAAFSRTEAAIGCILLFVVLFGGARVLLPSVAIRLAIGCGLGYVLSRAWTGFAGGVNRACRTGSTALMRAMMLMFFVTSITVAAYALGTDDITTLDLWVNPINVGLILGGIIFGFGMSMSSCCASGVMTDIITSLPRAAITLLFFCIGVFVGFPLQNTQSWITDSWFSTKTGMLIGEGNGGVFFPDWFEWDGFHGYLGAVILTGILCLIVYYLSMRYEKKRRTAGTFTGVDTEMLQNSSDEFDLQSAQFFSRETYYHLFAKPFTLTQGALGLTVLFGVILAIFRSEWGASTPYGLWFGKLLMLFGLSSEQVAGFAHGMKGGFELPFFQHPITVQNLGIMLGTLIYLLMAGNFVKTFKSGLKITGREVLLFALGGFAMGFGTRLSNGCNVGALYSPIAAFSLSGWIFLLCMVVGGVLGNRFFMKVMSKK